MTDRTIFSLIAAGTRRRLRAASICLLCVAASVSISASLPAMALPAHHAPRLAVAQSAQQRYRAAILAASTSDSQVSIQASLRPALRSPSNAPSHWIRRVFLENTSPIPDEALQIAQRLVLEPFAPLRTASPVLSTNSISTSNRQRAP